MGNGRNNALRDVTGNTPDYRLQNTDKHIGDEREEEAGDLREVKPEHADNWQLAYQDLFVLGPSPLVMEDLYKLHDAGLTDRLIIAVLKRGRDQKKPNPPMWGVRVLSTLASQGVTTVDEWAEHEAAERAEREREARERAEERARVNDAARFSTDKRPGRQSSVTASGYAPVNPEDLFPPK